MKKFKTKNVIKRAGALAMAALMITSIAPATSLFKQNVKAAESEDFYVGNAPCSSIDSLPNGTYENITANVYVPGPLNKVLGVNAFLTNPDDPFGAGGGKEKAPTDPVYNNATLTVSGEGDNKKYTLDVDIKNVVFTLLDAKSGDNITIKDYTLAEGNYPGYTGRISHFTFELCDLSGKYTLSDCVEYPTLLGAFWNVPLNVAIDLQSVATQTNNYTFTDESGLFTLNVNSTKENLDGASLVVDTITEGKEYDMAYEHAVSSQLNVANKKDPVIRMYHARLIKDGKEISSLPDSQFQLIEKLSSGQPVGDDGVYYINNDSISNVESANTQYNYTDQATYCTINNNSLGYIYYVTNSNAKVTVNKITSDILTGVSFNIYGTLNSNAIPLVNRASTYVKEKNDADNEIKAALNDNDANILKAYDLCIYSQYYSSTTFDSFSSKPFTLRKNESKMSLEFPINTQGENISDAYDIYMITKNLTTGELSSEKMPSYKKDDNTIVADWMDMSSSDANTNMNDDLIRFIVNCSDYLEQPVSFEQKVSVDNCASYIAIVKNNTPETYDVRYTGAEQTGVAEGDAYTLSGTIKATEVGTYTAYATLKDGYNWSDGDTNRTKTVEWTLKPSIINVSYNKLSSGSSKSFNSVDDAKAYFNTYTLTYSGFIGDDSAETLSGFEAPTIILPELENGKAYNISASGGNPTANYEFNYIAPTIMIGYQTITTPEDIVLQYTGKPQTTYISNDAYTVEFEECDASQVIDTGFYHATITANEGYKFSSTSNRKLGITIKIKGTTITVKPQGVTTSGLYAEDVTDADMELVSGLDDGQTLESLNWKNGTIPKLKGKVVHMYDFMYNLYITEFSSFFTKEQIEAMCESYKGIYQAMYYIEDTDPVKNYEISVDTAYGDTFENAIPVISSTHTDESGETVINDERTTELVTKYKNSTDNPLNVNLGVATVIPTEIMEVLAAKENTTVNLKMNNVVSTFNTDDIKDTKASKQTLTYNTSNIPTDVIEQYRNSSVNTVKQINRVSDGNLGEATASLSLGGPAANEYANVYRYNADKKELELVSVGKADEKGNVSVTIPESGDYAVMMSTKDMSKITLDPGTYKLTSNLYVSAADNAVLGVNAYLTNPNNPLGIVPDGFTSVEPVAPVTPVTDNAKIVVAEDGSMTLILDVVNPVFTLQKIAGCTNANVLAEVKDNLRYEGNNHIGKDGRITRLYINLSDYSGSYKFADCVEFPTLLEEEWTVPLTLDVDYTSAVKVSDDTTFELPKNDDNNNNNNNNEVINPDNNTSDSNTSTPSTSDTNNSDVKTGDTSNSLIYIIVMIAALAVVGGTIVVSRKKAK